MSHSSINNFQRRKVFNGDVCGFHLRIPMAHAIIFFSTFNHANRKANAERDMILIFYLMWFFSMRLVFVIFSGYLYT